MDKDVIHIYNGILVIKKNETLPFAATWMDLEIITLNELSQEEKDKYYILLSCEIQKMIQINLEKNKKMRLCPSYPGH